MNIEKIWGGKRVNNIKSPLIDQYLEEIRIKLPEWIKQDPDEISVILNEIKSHLHEALIEISSHRAIEEKDVQKAIKDCGDPENIAFDYYRLSKPSKPLLQSSESAQDFSKVSLSNESLQIIENARQLVLKKKKRQLLSVLEMISVGYQHIPATERYRIIAEIFQMNPDFYMNKLYTPMQKFMIDSYSIDLFHLERYLISYLSLNLNETIISGFFGKFQLGKHEIKGRIYITPLRIICQGVHGPTTQTFLIFRPGLAHVMARDEIVEIQKAMKGVISPKPCYGIQYGLRNPSKLSMKKNKLEFNCEIGFMKHDRIKYKTMKMSIEINDYDQIPIVWEFFEKNYLQF